MSHRYDAPLISGAHIHGDFGLGVLGSAVPSTGDNGPGYIYNDLSLPADAAKEVRGLIVTPPSSGTFFAYEDSSFEFTAPDGSYSFTYRLFVDGVDLGTASVTLNVGVTGVTIACTLGTATATGYAADISQAQTLLCNLGLAVAEGYQASIQENGNTVISCAVGSAAAVGYQASVIVPQPVTIACSVGVAQAIGRQASVIGGGDFVRAPSGSGFTPRKVTTSRPSQLNTRRY